MTRYHDAALAVYLAAALGAAGFAWEGWNPFLGFALSWFIALISMALLLSVTENDQFQPAGAKPAPPDPELREERPAAKTWRSIDSAPRDGTVISADSGDGTPMSVRWRQPGCSIPGWVRTLDGSPVEPTRWLG
jgi:hypothetical protein